jgi:Ca2+-binding RTX toxin-like protein
MSGKPYVFTTVTIPGTEAADLLVSLPARDEGWSVITIRDFVLVGLGGDDTLRSNETADTLLGGLGNDQLIAGRFGRDILEGGEGADTLIGTDSSGQNGAVFARYAAPVLVNLGNPAANTGEAAGDLLIDIAGLMGSDFADTLIGGNGSDLLFGRGGADRLEGGPGDDALEGGAGADTLVGDSGAGFAGLDLAYYRTAVTLNLADPSANTGDALGDVLLGITGVAGSTAADQLTGHADRPSLLAGMGGADTLAGGGAGDTLVGGSGGDSLHGGGGADSLWGDTADGMPDFGLDPPAAGPDTLRGGDGHDTLLGGNYTDLLDGGTGDDLLLDGYSLDGLEGEAGNDTLVGGAGNDRLHGGLGNDKLQGGSGDDTLSEMFGFNLLDGGEGADSLRGGGHNDTLTGGPGEDVDTLRGGDGDDRLQSEAPVVLVMGDPLWGTALPHTGTGDILDGEDGADRLFGGGGADLLDGGTGNDRLFGGDGDDLLAGGKDRALSPNPGDILPGGDDRLEGQGGNDRLLGLTGRDHLLGGDGADTLVGGAGADTLRGGAGADVFVFAAGDSSAAAMDIICGFEDGLDIIDLSALGVTFAALSFATMAAGGSFTSRWTQVSVELGADDLVFAINRMQSAAFVLDASDFLFG